MDTTAAQPDSRRARALFSKPDGDKPPPARVPWKGSRAGAYTYRYHRVYATLEGFYGGVMAPALLTLIIIKEWQPSEENRNLYSTLINWLPAIAMVLAPIWNTTGSTRSRYLFVAGLIGRLLPGLAFAAVNAPWEIVALVTFSNVICCGIPPAQNALLARNYTARERERYYGLTKLYQIPLLLGANLGFAALLDVAPSSWRWVLPLAGVVSFVSLLTLNRVKKKRTPMPPLAMSQPMPSLGLRGPLFVPLMPLRKIGVPLGEAVKLMNRDRDFAIFEMGFMIYGFGFMIALPVIPLYYDKVFTVDYKAFSLHTVVAFHAVVFLWHWALRGRPSNWSAARIAGTAHALLIFYPLLLMLAALTHQLWIAFAGFLVFGSGMVFLDYAWNLGPIRFAKGRDAMPYVSAHTMMVGVRGLLAFPASYALLSLTPGSFWLSLSVPVALFVCALLSMVWLERRLKRA